MSFNSLINYKLNQNHNFLGSYYNPSTLNKTGAKFNVLVKHSLTSLNYVILAPLMLSSGLLTTSSPVKCQRLG